MIFTTASKYITLQEGLKTRAKADSLLIIWKSRCHFRNIEMQREICEPIENDYAASWLFVLNHGGAAQTRFGGLQLTKRSEIAALEFTRTFADPTSVTLTAEAEMSLRVLLQDLLMSQRN
ncbi:MAG: hypothetical protein JST89_06305 [Cyanobacteria bacterium SZAS-4]|nr:hypothetical protein [Cyanobacteria bacterium SZAS-4]